MAALTASAHRRARCRVLTIGCPRPPRKTGSGGEMNTLKRAAVLCSPAVLALGLPAAATAAAGVTISPKPGTPVAMPKTQIRFLVGPGQYGPMIFDDDGRLVWFRALRPGEDAADLQTQVLRGKSDLTWWQGRTLTFGYGLGEDVIANANYKTVAVVRAGNGLQADEHGFDVTPQGAAWMLAYDPVEANLSSAGGSSRGVAVDGVIQEIDVHTGLVMWEWHS